MAPKRLTAEQVKEVDALASCILFRRASRSRCTHANYMHQVLDVMCARRSKYKPLLAETITGVSRTQAKKIARLAFMEDVEAREKEALAQDAGV